MVSQEVCSAICLYTRRKQVWTWYASLEMNGRRARHLEAATCREVVIPGTVPRQALDGRGRRLEPCLEAGPLAVKGGEPESPVRRH